MEQSDKFSRLLIMDEFSFFDEKCVLVIIFPMVQSFLNIWNNWYDFAIYFHFTVAPKSMIE